MTEWLEWYQGHVPTWHDYTIYNGSKRVARQRESMHMAKQVCQDWASLLMNERLEIIAEDDTMNAILQETFEANDFRVRANQLVELTFALGTGAFVEYLNADGTIAIDYVRGDCIYPLSWDNGTITECAFASSRHIDGKPAYYINIHRLEGSYYVIENHLIDKEGGRALELPEGLLPEVNTGSSRARFQILTPNIVNNLDLDSPYGISVYANAIPRLKKVDLIFDSGNNEFNLGRKRIILPLTMTQTALGDALDRPVFDPQDVAFYVLDVEDAQQPIDLTGQLRINEHSQGLQDALNYLSDGVGLGSGRYDYQGGGGLVTATQVISEKSDLYQNLQKHELVLRQVLEDVCNVIAEFAGYPNGIEVSINFDDSIITDKNTDIDNAIKLTSSGLKSKTTAMMELYEYTEEQALAELARITQEQMALLTMQEDLFDTEGEVEDDEADTRRDGEDSERDS